MFHRHPKLHIFKTQILLFFSQTAFTIVFSIWVNGSSILTVSQVEKLESFFTPMIHLVFNKSPLTLILKNIYNQTTPHNFPLPP